MRELIEGIKKFDHLAIAKAISLIENREPQTEEILNNLVDNIGKAFRIGFTGPPGVGKSTLVSKIAEHIASQNKTVSIIAVDPTSPFTGGALLGDRVRMSELNSKIFIRSMATRGTLGGLANATIDAADVLDAAGSDYILIETVGVGQQEIEISKFSDCVVLVLSPEGGDSVQMLKAGILEAADIITVNKFDRPNSERFMMEIESSIRLTRKNDTIITKTSAFKGEGIQELIKIISEFITEQQKSGKFVKRRDEVLKNRIKRSCQEYLSQSFQKLRGLEENLDKSAKIIKEKKKGIYDEVKRILKEFYGAKTG